MSLAPETEDRLAVALLDRRQQLSVGGMAEAGDRPFSLARKTPLDAAQPGTAAWREAKRGHIEEFLAAIRESDGAGSGIDAAHEEGGLLDLDLAAKAADLDDVLPLLGQIAHRAIEALPEPAVADRLSVVRPGPVVMQSEPEGSEGRRALHPGGSGSGSRVPSGCTRNRPMKS